MTARCVHWRVAILENGVGVALSKMYVNLHLDWMRQDSRHDQLDRHALPKLEEFRYVSC